jgi:hypothetical protein
MLDHDANMNAYVALHEFSSLATCYMNLYYVQPCLCEKGQVKQLSLV